ncbi:MAG TPA: hypothetical protein VGI44_00815 [Acidimicrobiales bacterium]
MGFADEVQDLSNALGRLAEQQDDGIARLAGKVNVQLDLVHVLAAGIERIQRRQEFAYEAVGIAAGDFQSDLKSLVMSDEFGQNNPGLVERTKAALNAP